MSDTLIPLSDKDFDEKGNLTSLKDKNVVIIFYADYCPACKGFKPTFEKAASSLQNDPVVVFAKVSTPENRDLMSRVRGRFPFEVQYIPTVISYNKGKYYSTYDYDHSNPQDRETYRTLPDVIEYAKSIGSGNIRYKN